MADEYTQHRQCQTCFVLFPSNRQLLEHVEEYRSRERLLVAELERCRMHIAQSANTSSGKDGDDGCSGEEDDQGSSIQTNPLDCPFDGCDRSEPYTSRGNLVRHFQTHVQCNETCPFCHEVFKQVNRYMRHDCKANRDEPKSILMQQRMAQFNGVVSRELDRLQGVRSVGKKRPRGAMDPDLERVRKTAKRSQVLSGEADEPSDSSYRSDYLTTRIGGTAEKVGTTTSRRAEQTFDEPPAILVLNDGDLACPAQTSADGDRAFADTGTVVSACNGSWPFVSADVNMGASDGEWAFSVMDVNASANNDDWAFAGINMTAGDGEWAFAPTVASMTANSDEWAFEIFR